eukprot:CAMPEP_0170848366 /NCGR_PEP_ID=MMETSP0734-20130129/9333_1 /TAXON_ID=186038 /ORGANISM="Fragilariopsis kerguelensis, Strain L26-C5" /LENGTH=214 /DNA_ID=CAMNT_0011217757 /DNA_START=113 /DNA_END=757 /DNA_ORIENTATION=-
MSTGALAFSSHSHSNKSAPATASTSTSSTLTKQAQKTQAQQQQAPSQSLSSRSEAVSRPTRRKSALAFSPTDIGDAATLLSLKVDTGAKAMATHTSPTQVLTDFSYVLFDPHKFFPTVKISKLRMRYAQVFGRLMILGTSVLPHHHGIIHPEEMAVQLYLLSVSMKPILRSMELYKCRAESTKKEGSTTTTTCVEECALEWEELEASLDIKNVV